MTLSPSELEQKLVHARALADVASRQTLKYFRQGVGASNKAEHGFDPVTIADIATEGAMREYLSLHCPNDGVLGEEQEATASGSGYTWVLDPIDGTRSFLAGLPVWVTLIALVDATAYPILGIIDQPYLKERYVGWNTGACLEQDGSTTLATNVAASISDFMASTTDPFLFSEKEAGAWAWVQQQAKVTRYGLDGYGYACLARGGLDLVLESGLAAYDIAALFPIIRGAGGEICDWSGVPAGLSTGQILAVANQKLLCEVLPHLK